MSGSANVGKGIVKDPTINVVAPIIPRIDLLISLASRELLYTKFPTRRVIPIIATAKAVRMQNVKRVQWHLLSNQTALVFCGFDFLTKTSISQCC
jgi:hypothetical protein